MLDIHIALALMAVLSIGGFFLAARLARSCTPRRRVTWLAVAVGSIVVYTLLLHDRLLLARLLPVSSVIVAGNVVPILSGTIVGLVWGVSRIPKARRAALLAVLTLATLRLVYRPLLGRAPRCGDLWEEGVCMQTTDATCGAAAAATLLMHHGIAASEQELADLCLTRNGTLRLGLYRGLRLKTRHTGWRVEVFSGDVAKLRDKARGPVLLFVGLRRGQRADPRYAQDWGWTPGLRHAVVLFGFHEDGFIDVGDPTMGREQWRAEALDVLWDGYAIRLVRQ